MAGDASGPLAVLGSIRDVMVSILAAIQQEGKRDEGSGAAASADAHSLAGFRQELSTSLRDAIQSGMSAFMGRAGVTAQPALPSVPAVATPARQPAPAVEMPGAGGTRPAFKPLDLGNPFASRPERKNPSDAASVPAVVSTIGPAPTANLLPTTVPAEMRTGANLPQVVPTTNQRPLPAVPSLTGGPFNPVPTATATMGTVGAVRPGMAGPGGGRLEGSSELLDASRRLNQSAGKLAEAARRNQGDTVELSDNWIGQAMRGLPPTATQTGYRSERPALLDRMSGSEQYSAAGGKGTGSDSDVLWLITRFFGVGK